MIVYDVCGKQSGGSLPESVEPES